MFVNLSDDGLGEDRAFVLPAAADVTLLSLTGQAGVGAVVGRRGCQEHYAQLVPGDGQLEGGQQEDYGQLPAAEVPHGLLSQLFLFLRTLGRLPVLLLGSHCKQRKTLLLFHYVFTTK